MVFAATVAGGLRLRRGFSRLFTKTPCRINIDVDIISILGKNPV